MRARSSNDNFVFNKILCAYISCFGNFRYEHWQSGVRKKKLKILSPLATMVFFFFIAVIYRRFRYNIN